MLSESVYETGPPAGKTIVKLFNKLGQLSMESAIMRRVEAHVVVALLTAALWPSTSMAQSFRLPLATGWAIQSSAAVRAAGDAISQPGFSTSGWHAAAVPGTIVGALVDE